MTGQNTTDDNLSIRLIDYLCKCGFRFEGRVNSLRRGCFLHSTYSGITTSKHFSGTGA